MSKRYIAKSSFSLGRGRVFVTGFQQQDNTQGYTEEQVVSLTAQQLRDHFDVVNLSGDSVVEEATAAPGELREVSRVCGECGFSAASNAGLAAHKRSHSE